MFNLLVLENFQCSSLTRLNVFSRILLLNLLYFDRLHQSPFNDERFLSIISQVYHCQEMSEKFVLNYLESEALKAGLSTDIDSLTSRELAEVLNREDKLKHLRDEFCFPKKGTIPEGNS